MYKSFENRRGVDEIKYVQWVNGQSSLSKKYQNHPKGIYIKTDKFDVGFDIEVEYVKNEMVVKVSHSHMANFFTCGCNIRFKDILTINFSKRSSIKEREDVVMKNVINWFVSMYGSEKMVYDYFKDAYKQVIEEFDVMYGEAYVQQSKTVNKAIAKFKQEFCIKEE